MGTQSASSGRNRKLVLIVAVSTLVVGVLAYNAASAAEVTDPNVCLREQLGTTVTLSWLDEGGTHVIRRNNRWLATPGSNVSTFVDTAAPPGATYVLRTWIGNVSRDRVCTATPPTTSSTTTTAPPPPLTGCTAERDGSTMTLEWLDDGGLHVIRRNNRWLATPGYGVSSYVDPSSPTGATYELRTWFGNQSVRRECLEQQPPPPPPPPADRTADRVIHISVDGLRSDHVTAELMPNLTQLMAEGGSTLNARTDPGNTQTLPNHTSQYTGRAVFGPWGHQVDINTDLGTTVHDEAGLYVSSVFDVVHDNGGSTLLYADKSKFDMIDRTWNDVNGAPDLTGADDGRDKIDTYDVIAPEVAVGPLFDNLEADPSLEFAFFHIRNPDTAGHADGWASAEYRLSATNSDTILGQIVDAIEAEPNWATSTAIIVTADHGGPTGGTLHDDETDPDNYTIPFVVWGPGVLAGADLYALNPTNRTDPGASQVPLNAPQPIRAHEVANLALEFLGYTSVPGSIFNQQQDLAIN